jgi:signal peptidase I
MSPAIGTTDYFLLLKSQPVQRWDIAGIRMPNTIQFPQAEMVKRVVGLPGETVELTPDGLLINGQRVRPPAGIGFYVSVNMLDQPLQSPDPRTAGNGCWGRPIKLMSDEYFVLGDNTTESYDSRLWPAVDGRQPGALPAARLSGRVAAIVWPPDRSRLFEQVPVSGSQK